jgi:hypothetical protein
MKNETLEEFIARGGKVQQVPAHVPEEKPVIVKSTANVPPKLMSLTDGEHFFAERSKRKVDQKKKFIDKLNKTNLPKEVIEKLMNAVKND